MGLVVIAHHEHFRHDEDDITILDECGRRNWVYVAKDLAVRKNPAELRALHDAGIHAVFLHGRRRPAEYLVLNFGAALLKILSKLERAPMPVHLVVTAGGRVAVVGNLTDPTA
jgi:hypothetical protein